MRYLTPLLFIAAGVVNLLPITGAISDTLLARLYQIQALDPDISLLLRHRAILFGIIGALLIYAAFQPFVRGFATLAGLVSMLSFCAFVFALQPNNASLVRIAWVDVFASIALIAAYGLHRGSS